MTVRDVQEILGARCLVGDALLDNEVHTACGSDMMSDVLAYVKDKALLLTGLTNQQVIRTAEMMDIHAIVFVRGKQPDEIMLGMANSKDMVILATELPMYISCGKLYSAGLAGNMNE